MDNLKSRRPQQAVIDGEADAGGTGRTDVNFLRPPLIAFPEEVKKQMGLGGWVVLRPEGEGRDREGGFLAVKDDGKDPLPRLPADKGAEGVKTILTSAFGA